MKTSFYLWCRTSKKSKQLFAFLTCSESQIKVRFYLIVDMELKEDTFIFPMLHAKKVKSRLFFGGSMLSGEHHKNVAVIIRACKNNKLFCSNLKIQYVVVDVFRKKITPFTPQQILFGEFQLN